MEALQAAVELKADRVEVCTCLEQGGLSPSLGFIQTSLDFGLSTHVLVRPRSGGFVYSPDEIQLILREVELLNSLDVDGIVVGLLKPNMRLERKVIQEIRTNFRKEVTLHRAFDDLVEWHEEMEFLKEIGVNRILTSGLATSVSKGIPTLMEMVAHAKGSIEIMAGGGINLANVAEIVQKVQPDAMHFSATTKESLDPSSFFSEERLVFDSHKAKKLVDLCRNFT